MSAEARAIGASHRARERNVPADFWWRSASGDVAAVFHGVGGQGAGEDLARRVRMALTEPRATSLEERARWPIDEAQALALSCVSRVFVAFGSMASLAVGGGRATLAHVGDARIYRVANGRIERLTRDHVWDVEGLPKNMLSRAIGVADEFAIDVREISCAPGDVLALCTRAVCDELGDELLAETIEARGREAANAIVDRMAVAAPHRHGAVALAFC